MIWLGLVVPNLKTVEKPLDINLISDTSDLTNLFPLCAVTRAQSKLASSRSDKPISKVPPYVHEDLLNRTLTKEELIKAQNSDPSLAALRHVAVEGKDLDTLPVFYYQDGVLMRAYRHSSLSKLDSWSETHQVVIPTSVRSSLLKLAHDGYSGHLGNRKTYHKLLAHFYWPGIKRDVTDYVKTCHICQLVGKPNQKIPLATLKSIPVVHEPFKRTVIDCVGPLPKTKKDSGHRSSAFYQYSHSYLVIIQRM